MAVTDSGVVTMLSLQHASPIKTASDAGVVHMLPRVSSTVTDYYLAAQPSGDLIAESGNTLTTEAGDTLITET